MKLIIFSDSHNTGFKRMVKVLEHEENFDGVFFLGDGESDADRLQNHICNTPMFRVQGNCDYRSEHPTEGVAHFSNHSIFFTHGHKQGVKTGFGGLFLEAMRSGANTILFGHTHIAYNKSYENYNFFNPGSICMPRNGPASYGRITLSSAMNTNPKFEIIEYATYLEI